MVSVISRLAMTDINVRVSLTTGGLLCTTVVSMAALPLPGFAQVIPDSTLGDEGSVVTPLDANTDRIDGGAVRDSLLFHSFDAFSIPEGQGVYFANPEFVNTIFSRVTGADPSLLFGTLGVLGDADLMFINPNGILFGPNAELDLRGAFTATTATEVLFPGGETFSALEPEAAPLLTVNVEAPVGVVFEGEVPGAIANEGNLSVPQDLVLTANNLDLQGQLISGGDLMLQGQDTVRIRDSEENPFVAAAGGQLTVQGNQLIDIFALNHPDSGLFSGGNLILRSTETVAGDIHYFSSGNIVIEQPNGSLGRLSSPHDPVLRALGDVYIQSYEGASLHILAGGKVEIPDYIWIQTSDLANGLEESVTLSNGDSIDIDGRSNLTVDIRAGIEPSVILSSIGLVGDGTFNPPLSATAEPTSAEIRVGTILFRDASLNNRISGQVYLSNQFIPNLDLNGDIRITDTIGLGAIENGELLTGGEVFFDSRRDILIEGNIFVSAAPIFSLFIGEGGDATFLANGNITLPPGSSVLSEGVIGGNITFDNNLLLSIDGGNFASGSVLSANYGGEAAQKGGDIIVDVGSLSLENGAQFLTATLGDSAAGNIYVEVDDSIVFNGLGIDNAPSGIFSQSFPQATGNSGNIEVITDNASITNGAQIAANTFGFGNSGNIEVIADGTIFLDGQSTRNNILFPSGILSRAEIISAGEGGNIAIIAGALNASNGAKLEASNQGQGENSGDIEITVRDSVAFDGFGSGAFSDLGSRAGGTSGNINVVANKALVLNGARLSTASRSQRSSEITRQGGNINILSGSVFLADEAILTTSTTGQSDAGDIFLQTNDLSVLFGSELDSSTSGSGNAGNIFLDVDERAFFDGMGRSGFPSIARSSTNGGSTGEGGDIFIQTSVLDIFNGAQLIAVTSGSGRAGDILVEASENITFSGTGDIGFASGAFSQVFLGASGEGGNISFESNTLSVLNGAQIGTSTVGSGNAGNIFIDAEEFVTFDGIGPSDFPIFSGALTNVLIDFAEGDGGDISIKTDLLSVTDGAAILADTRGRGNSGNIAISDAQFVTLSDGSISTSVDALGIGEGGTVSVETESLSLTNNSVISSEAQGIGSAGNVLIDALDRVFLDQNSAISTSASNDGNRAGLIDIAASNLYLDNQSRIFASTESGDGGDITLRNIDSLILRRGRGIGGISTTAGTEEAGGDGGNITFEGDFIFAAPQENSDITANAFLGDGGEVSITARRGIFGIEFRDGLTPLSDITASSEQGDQGIVTITTLEIDPTQGIDTLPNEPRGPEVIEGCAVRGDAEAVGFFDLGRGGRLPGPDDLITTDATIVEWTSLDLVAADSDTREAARSPLASTPAPYLIATCGSLTDE